MRRLYRPACVASATWLMFTASLLAGGAPIAPTAASAASNFFCPPVPNSQVLISGNNRCVSGRYYTLTRVIAATYNGNGVDHCAIAKQYSDGGGGNVIEPRCGTLQTQVTACVSPRSGYAAILNRSASGHFFQGRANYGDCSG